jgi:hypothetical protein
MCVAATGLSLGLRVQPFAAGGPSPDSGREAGDRSAAGPARARRALLPESVRRSDPGRRHDGRQRSRDDADPGDHLPSRYRFSHRTGADYRHYIETTLLGAPLLSVDESFVDGKARLELPFRVSQGPQVDQGANLALWAELVWAPAVWATHPAVRWEPNR